MVLRCKLPSPHSEKYPQQTGYRGRDKQLLWTDSCGRRKSWRRERLRFASRMRWFRRVLLHLVLSKQAALSIPKAHTKHEGGCDKRIIEVSPSACCAGAAIRVPLCTVRCSSRHESCPVEDRESVTAVSQQKQPPDRVGIGETLSAKSSFSNKKNMHFS